MDDFLNAVWFDKPYTISHEDDEPPIVISSSVLQFCAKQDMYVLDFLYRSYRKELNGAIINVENDFNPQLQVSAFLGALHNALKTTFIALILCPDEAIIKWHYYMTWCGIFEIKIITPETDLNEINEDIGMILILGFSNIKLAESLKEYDFFSVIIDRFDEVATKLIIRKLQGSFNIGITFRNFYTHPDQKLQWTMLNWSNPGCVGKLVDFYETDNDNFAHFRDNYKEWWFRITWTYCESFVRPSVKQKENLHEKLINWANEQKLSRYSLKPTDKKHNTRKRKGKVETNHKESDDEDLNSVELSDKRPSKRNRKTEIKSESDSEEYSDRNRNSRKRKEKVEESSSKGINIPKRTKTVYNKKTKTKNIPYTTKTNTKLPKNEQDSDSTNSSGTIIYEPTDLADDEALQDAENDEPPIGAAEFEEKISEETACDLNDTESVSSGEKLFISLISDEKPVSKRKVKSCPQENINDDDSDLFLKSMAAKDDELSPHKICNTQAYIDSILNKESPESSIDIEQSEQRVLYNDVPTESDTFLKEICSQKDREHGIKNNNYACTSNSMSDVDLLVAEVMKMVRE